MKEELEGEIARFEKLLDDLTAQLPKHSIPASMIIRIEEIEEQLINVKARLLAEIQVDAHHGDKC